MSRCSGAALWPTGAHVHPARAQGLRSVLAAINRALSGLRAVRGVMCYPKFETLGRAADEAYWSQRRAGGRAEADYAEGDEADLEDAEAWDELEAYQEDDEEDYEDGNSRTG